MSREILPEHPAELTLLDYLVGHLPPDRSDQIRRHVSACRACRRTIAELSLTVDELDRLPTVPIPHDTVPGSPSRPRRRGSRFLRLLPALVLVIAHWGFGLAGLPLAVVVMCTALPAGSNVLIFSQRYETLEGEATTVIVVSTLAFVLTAPIWLAVLAALA